jgi:hypothetical protein
MARKRTKKTKTHRSRKAQNASGKMICPTCDKPHFLTTHHIRGRDIPDCNDESNLADICDNCHREVHEGELIIEGWFMTTNGRELIFHRKDEESFSGDDAVPHIIKRK